MPDFSLEGEVLLLESLASFMSLRDRTDEIAIKDLLPAAIAKKQKKKEKEKQYFNLRDKSTAGQIINFGWKINSQNGLPSRARSRLK